MLLKLRLLNAAFLFLLHDCSALYSSSVAEENLMFDDHPSLPILRHFPVKDKFINLVSEMQNDYGALGGCLLIDDNGNKVKGIETAKHGDQVFITEEILRQWLNGKGRYPIEWGTLVKCLRVAGLNIVADYIDDKLTQRQQQQPLSAVQEASGADGIAQKNLQKIEGKFGWLLFKVGRKLREKTVNTEDLKFITHVVFRGDYIPKTSNINEIFEAVIHHKLLDYWNYYPLETIVDVLVPDDPEITLLMETYRQDLESYKVTTKIIEHITAAKATPSKQKELERPARYDQQYYQTLSWKLNLTRVTDHSLKYIDDLWNKFANLYNLPPRVVLLDHIHRGCVSVVWLIPTHLAPQIHLAHLSDAFYCKHKITRVEFDGICIYQEEEEHHDEVYVDKGRDKCLPLSPPSFSFPSFSESQVIVITIIVGILGILVVMVRNCYDRASGNKHEKYDELTEMSTQLQAETETVGGIECEFIETFPSAFETECLICKYTLCEPYLVSCCGYSFCKACIQRVQEGTNSCPICKKNFKLYPNQGLKRSLEKLHVYCTRFEHSCEWRGELGDLIKTHLRSKECPLKRKKTVTLLPFYFEMKIFVEKMELSDMELHSSPFYTQHRGYRMQLRVNPNINNDDSFLSVQAYLMKGEYDDHLKWPFQGRVIIQLCNQLQDKFHCGYTISGRVTSGESKIGDPVFISYNDLYFNTEKHCQYLEKGYLSFRFITVELVSEHEVLPIQITMTNLEEYKIYNKEWYSSPFYTSYPRGYRMCLRVDANGYGRGKGTHISVFVHLMRGEFDDELDWPFQGSVTVTMLNHLEDNGHISNTIDFADTAISYCSRVTSMERNPKGWGRPKFVAHDKLKYDPIVYHQYLQYDCLCFRVQFEMQ